MKKILNTFVSLAVGLSATLLSPLSVSQESLELEETLVTARKREESLQEVPVAITAFSSDDILQKDMVNLEDVGSLTPGFQFLNQGNQQPGRYNTQLQFRGLTTAQFSPSFATGALFIDGVYVLNGGTSLTLMDLERVEVIKGPQSAHFGRNTFGGAVNLITRNPDMSEFGGEIRLRTTSRSNTELSAMIEGPLIEDKLSFSLSARTYDKEGHYKASSGVRTGDEETSTTSAVLFLTPTENLDIKLRYSTSEDDDGPPTQAYISGVANDNCTGTPATNPLATRGPIRYICGKIPYNANPVTIDGIPTKLISSNTSIATDLPWASQGATALAYLTDPSTQAPQLSGLPEVTEVGMKRDTERLSLAANWDIMGSGYNLSFVYGKNEQDANWLRDLDNTDRQNWWSRDPQMMEDESWEIRISSPQDQRLRWGLGYSHYEQEFSTSGGGGDAYALCIKSFGPGGSDNYGAPALGGDCFFGFGPFTNSLVNSDESEVDGVFFSVDFDITDSITAILEGRWVDDELTKGGSLTRDGLAAGGAKLVETFDDFLPRAILRWTPSENTTVYASYSEGLLAGDFNTFFAQATPYEREQYVSQNPNIAELLPEETLEAMEIGWKQSFMDGRGQINLAYYQQEWKGIKGRSTYRVNETCKEIGANCPDASYIGGGKVIEIDGQEELFYNTRNILVPGDAEIDGFEVEVSFLATENLLFQATGSWIDSEYTDYEYNFVAALLSYSQMKGNKTPRQAEETFTFSGTYSFEVMGMDAYARADWFHQGKAYADEGNLAHFDPYDLVNLRLGVSNDNVLVELFVDNAFDEEAWQTGARWTDFSKPGEFGSLAGFQGIVVSPLDKREFGIRMSLRF